MNEISHSIGWALLGLGVILMMGLASVSDSDPENPPPENPRNVDRSHQEWKETKDGIRYFKACIEGLEFMATPNHTNYSLAGPIGDCNE